MDDIKDQFVRLEEISKKGVSVIVKIDGERWGATPSLPFTVLIFGGHLDKDNTFRIDSSNLNEAIQAGIDYYERVPTNRPNE